MKYLKHFNESVENTEQTLTEICYDLTDNGEMEVDFTESYGNKIIHIHTTNKRLDPETSSDRGFSFDEILEVYNRILDFLGDRYIDAKIQYQDHHYNTIYGFLQIFRDSKGNIEDVNILGDVKKTMRLDDIKKIYHLSIRYRTSIFD